MTPPPAEAAAAPHTPDPDQPLTRARLRAGAAAHHALRLPPVPRGFRADIEGLRAVAVLGVVLWHAGVAWFPGGYAGVDVFFVVSGFLMTALLLEEARERGRIAVGRFYARRARRLLPAALAALTGTALLSLLFLPRSRWGDIGGDLLTSALYVVNWRLAGREVDYLDTERAASPVQHYWSLSVEEQFYVVWPLVLVVLLLAAAGRARVFTVAAWAGTVVLFAVSLWVSWWWTGQDPSAYFVTPTRVYELMLGALVALGAWSWPRLPRAVAAAVGWAGLAMAVASLFVLDADTPFPGTWALLPTVGTAMVLVAGPAAGSWGPVAVLRAGVMQWVGRLSYSLYLWHWPFVAVAAELSDVGRGGPTTLPVHWGLLAVAVAVVPAWLSFRYVEDPVRRHGRVLAASLPQGVVTQRTLRLGLNCTLAGALLGTVLMAAAPAGVTGQSAQWRTPDVVEEVRSPVGAGTLGAGGTAAPGREGAAADDPDGAAATTAPHGADDAATTTGPPADPLAAAQSGAGASTALGEPLPEVELPQTVGALAVPLEQVPDDRAVLVPEGCNAGLAETEVTVCRAGDPDGRVSVALVGDSHAAMWVTALDVLGREHGWQVLTLSKSSCPPTLGLEVRRSEQAGPYRQCTEWQQGLGPELERLQPDLVLLSSASYQEGPERISDGLARRVQDLEDAGIRAGLIRDVPRPPFNVPDCLMENQDDVPACAFERAAALERSGTGHDELAGMLPDLPVVDLTDAVCPARVCSPIVGEVVVWHDSNHLSATYIRSLSDLVDEQVRPMVELAVLRDRVADLGRGAELGGSTGQDG